MIWARKRTGSPIIRISSLTEANEFLKKHSTFVVGLFENFEVCEMLAITLLLFSKDIILLPGYLSNFVR